MLKKEGAGENGSTEMVAIEHQTFSAALLHSNRYKLLKANNVESIPTVYYCNNLQIAQLNLEIYGKMALRGQFLFSSRYKLTLKWLYPLVMTWKVWNCMMAKVSGNPILISGEVRPNVALIKLEKPRDTVVNRTAWWPRGDHLMQVL